MPNYAVWNPHAYKGATHSQAVYDFANTRFAATEPNTYGQFALSSLAVPTYGKWYVEIEITSNGSDWPQFGFVPESDVSAMMRTDNIQGGTFANMSVMRANAGILYAYGQTSQTSYGSSINHLDVVCLAFDGDAGKVWWGKNGEFFGDPTAGTGNGDTFSEPVFVTAGSYLNAGKLTLITHDFRYTPPAGYKELNTENFSTPVITDPKDYFDMVTYTGTGTVHTEPLQFQPDLIWCKSYSLAQGQGGNHVIVDSQRGFSKEIYPNLVNVSSGNTGSLTGVSEGIQVGNNGDLGRYNAIGQNYICWAWKSGDTSIDGTNNMGGAGAGASCSYRVNTTSKFSIVEYTIGTSPDANPTIPHGLGVNLSTTPHFIIVKQTVDNISDNDPARWAIRHSSHGGNGFQTTGDGDSTNGTSSATTVFRTGYFDSTNFAVGGNSMTGKAGQSYVAYCWAEVEGFSKFGLYQDSVNGSDYFKSSPFVYLGFRPALVIIKSTSNGRRWVLRSSKRKGYNPVDEWLQIDTDHGEQEGSAMAIDFMANGFKIRGGSGEINTTNESYIYAAWAEAPLKYATAR